MSHIDTPLHHCYLVPAVSITGCLTRLKEEIAATVPAEGLTLDVDSVEFFDIQMARELRSLGLQRAKGETRCLVRAFDTIGGDAQNALLKIIEEPAEGVHFFLVTPNADALLETVRSRVWQLPGLCGADEDELSELVDELFDAPDLPGALAVTAKLETRVEVRTFIKLLARRSELREREYRLLAAAVEDAAGWSRGTGASVKLLGQHLAIASQRSTVES